MDEELLALLERLSLQMGTQGRLQQSNGHSCPFCNFCLRCLRRPGRSASGPRRAASAPSGQATKAEKGAVAKRPNRTATWVPSEAPAAEKAKSKLKAKSSKGAEKQRRSSKSLEDKAPSPRPPRGATPRLDASVSVPQLRATVEVRPRRRATPKATTKRTPAPEPPPKAVTAAAPPSLPAPAEAPPGEAKLRGRRGSRNLLAELADPDRELRWEPVTMTRDLTAFEPPARKLAEVPTVPEPRVERVESAREIFYGSPEKPSEVCHNCGRTFTEDSIFCRHCGAKRRPKAPLAPSEKEAPSLSAVRFNPRGVGPSDTAAPPAEPLNLDSATRQLEQLVQETHQALVRDGIINGEHTTVPSATPNLDAVDRALEELQRGLLEIDHVLAKPMPDAPNA